MIQALLWQLLWAIVKIVFDVGKDFIAEAIKAVADAENLKKDDGTPYSGPEKKDYVVAQLVKFWGQVEWVEKGQRITNAIVEFAVSYIKSK